MENYVGVYDMSGNMQEWCHDWWADASNGFNGMKIAPQGPAVQSTNNDHTVSHLVVVGTLTAIAV